MSRALKQIFYGVFYLIVFAAIAMGAFFRYLKPAASCFDRVQNQGEQGIDCGGPCANFCTATLGSIQTMEAHLFLNGQGHATFLAKVLNPNGDFGAVNLPFAFRILDVKTGAEVQSVAGAAYLYPNQARYLVVPNYAVSDRSTSSFGADLVIATSGIAWTPSSTMGSVPVFTFSNITTTSTASGTITVSGSLGSQESVLLRRIEVDVIFENQYQIPVGASRTMIDQVPANGSVPFSISYPFRADMAPGNTVVEAYALRS